MFQRLLVGLMQILVTSGSALQIVMGTLFSAIFLLCKPGLIHTCRRTTTISQPCAPSRRSLCSSSQSRSVRRPIAFLRTYSSAPSYPNLEPSSS